jgi:hypothetical protein
MPSWKKIKKKRTVEGITGRQEEEEEEVFKASKKTARSPEVEKKTGREMEKKLEKLEEIKEEIKDILKENQEFKREIERLKEKKRAENFEDEMDGREEYRIPTEFWREKKKKTLRRRRETGMLVKKWKD